MRKMPKIKWCGNRPWDTEFPESPLPDTAKQIERPQNIFIACFPYGIIPLLFCFALLFLKWFVFSERAVNILYLPIGIILGLLLMPAHEILHAICYKKGQVVYVGICLKKFAAFAVCHEPISRRRFVVMSLMPTLAGIIPLIIFLICPANEIISGICIPVGIMGMISPMPDYMDIHIICKQTPRGAFIQTQNDGYYWYL